MYICTRALKVPLIKFIKLDPLSDANWWVLTTLVNDDIKIYHKSGFITVNHINRHKQQYINIAT